MTREEILEIINAMPDEQLIHLDQYLNTIEKKENGGVLSFNGEEIDYEEVDINEFYAN